LLFLLLQLQLSLNSCLHHFLTNFTLFLFDFLVNMHTLFSQHPEFKSKFVVGKHIVIFMFTKKSAVGTDQAFVFQTDEVCSFVVKQALLELQLFLPLDSFLLFLTFFSR